jgi:7-cyano-7-deazaguanine synthase
MKSNVRPLEVPAELAILVSGGLDSAVLVGEALESGAVVHPVYVRAGSVWEAVELQFLERFLSALHRPELKPLTVLQQPVTDLYENHWSLSGQGVPGHDTPDEAVYLPGRNVLLLSKAMIWCYLHGVPAVALAPLAANPFPDATPAFFAAFQDVVNEAIAGRVRVLWPYLEMKKVDVVRRGRNLPLQHTFSCIQPVRGKHCGNCNKCAERQRAFAEAGVPDPSEYVRI